MPDTKISALTALTAPASGDLIPIVDISDTTMAASGTTKRITYSDLGFLPLAGGTVTGALAASAAGVAIDATSGSVRSFGALRANFLNRNDGGFSIIGNPSNYVQIFDGAGGNAIRIDNTGKVGIGTTAPSYQLHVNTDSAGKPGVGGLWTVVSDERIKANIVPADLSRCYDIVKQVGLKHFGFKPGVYTDEQVKDRNALGWIAQDVQKVFGKAVSVKPFTLQTDIPDGTETYEEQAFTVHITNKVETSIQIVDGNPVRVSKDVQTEEKVLLFDEVVVVDEDGEIVLVDDEPLTHKMPRMVTKTRPKVRREVIEDCLDLNAGQMHAALYGAVQHLMSVVEEQAEAIAELQASV